MQESSPLSPPPSPSTLLQTHQPLPQERRGTQGRLPGPEKTYRAEAETRQTSQAEAEHASLQADAECSLVSAPSSAEELQVPRRGGASPSLMTQAQSPSNVQLGSIRQWERARGRSSKVNGPRRLPITEGASSRRLCSQAHDQSSPAH